VVALARVAGCLPIASHVRVLVPFKSTLFFLLRSGSRVPGFADLWLHLLVLLAACRSPPMSEYLISCGRTRSFPTRRPPCVRGSPVPSDRTFSLEAACQSPLVSGYLIACGPKHYLPRVGHCRRFPNI